jgi:hypothetical protein
MYFVFSTGSRSQRNKCLLSVPKDVVRTRRDWLEVTFYWSFCIALHYRLLTSNDTFLIYRKAFCRVLPVVFSRSGVTNEGFPAYWFRLPDNVFDSPEKNPDNACYCRPEVAPCLLSGLADITPCYYSKFTSCSAMTCDDVRAPKISTHYYMRRLRHLGDKSLQKVGNHLQDYMVTQRTTSQ